MLPQPDLLLTIASTVPQGHRARFERGASDTPADDHARRGLGAQVRQQRQNGWPEGSE